MLVTVAICTWNREKFLDRCLQNMRELVIPNGIDWELIVVNNSSTDHTDDVLSRHAANLPLRQLWEPNQGKSHALNTATVAARGELILWTDDDVLVDPLWLVEYVSAARSMPDASFFGGPIHPLFEGQLPRWIQEAWPWVSSAYAERNLGNECFEFDDETHAFGANFAVRTSVQSRYRYNTQLGRVGVADVRGEETEMQIRMLRDDLCGRWIPTARVTHLIPTERMTLDHIRRFYFGIGEAYAVMNDTSRLADWQRVWCRSRLWSRVFTTTLKYQYLRLIGKSGKWARYFTRSSFLRGRLRSLSAPT